MGRYLRVYRANMSRREAALRSGVSEVRWEQVENGWEPDEEGNLAPISRVPASAIAAMCVAVGADTATALRLAGHDPSRYTSLIDNPPTHSMHVDATAGGERAAAQVAAETRRRVAVACRDLANEIAEHVPDDRLLYWSGYIDALRRVVDEQMAAAARELESQLRG